MRDIMKEFRIKNVKKADDYCDQSDEPIRIVNVDPNEPDDEMDEEIQALVESLSKVNTSEFDPDED